jgi:outer membrane protein OmpA-like peptidoglycan-associated protein
MPRANAKRRSPFWVAVTLVGMVALPGLCAAADGVGIDDDQLPGITETHAAFETDTPTPPSGDELYASALLELQAGRFEMAQRQFEMFVASAPNSPLTADARKHLSELYNRPMPDALGAVPGRHDRLSTPVDRGAPVSPSPGASVRRAALPQPVAAAVEDSFIAEAGDRIFFAAGSSDLGARARAVIAAQARWLKRRSELHAVVEGHADDAPQSMDQHERLSAARAEAVSARLVEEGIARERISIAPWGRDRPVAICDGTDCAAQNRRAVTVLTPKAQHIGGLGMDAGGTPYAAGIAAPAR